LKAETKVMVAGQVLQNGEASIQMNVAGKS